MTQGVSSIVGIGREPAPIPTEEIERIQASCASGLEITPWPYLERGDLVRVECGPLQGVEGIFLNEKNTCRLVVSVEILRRSVAVEVDRNWIRPIAKRGGATVDARISVRAGSPSIDILLPAVASQNRIQIPVAV
jgi:transcription antitermination factor NusG